MNKTLLASLVAATATFVAAPSFACSCLFGWSEFVAPADGAAGVPTNAKIWIGGSHWGAGEGNPAELRLVDSAGEEVEVALSEMWGDSQVLAVLSPSAPLEVGASYSVLKQGGESLSTFVVGEGEDVEAPGLPVETGREASSDARGPFPPSSCGYSDMVVIDVQSDGLFVVANITDEDALDTEALSGEASQMGFEGEIRMGTAGCTFSWPGAEPGATTEVRLGTFDIAGNFSGWTEDEAIALPLAGTTTTGSSCSAATSATPGVFALLFAFLGLAAVRRR